MQGPPGPQQQAPPPHPKEKESKSGSKSHRSKSKNAQAQQQQQSGGPPSDLNPNRLMSPGMQHQQHMMQQQHQHQNGPNKFNPMDNQQMFDPNGPPNRQNQPPMGDSRPQYHPGNDFQPGGPGNMMGPGGGNGGGGPRPPYQPQFDPNNPMPPHMQQQHHFMDNNPQNGGQMMNPNSFQQHQGPPGNGGGPGPGPGQQGFDPYQQQGHHPGMMIDPNGPPGGSGGQVLPQMLQNNINQNPDMHGHHQMHGSMPDSLGLDNFNDPLLFND